MTIPADVMPFVLMGVGVVLILVGFAWLQDEVDSPDRRWWLILDLISSGRPFAFVAVGIMVAGAFLISIALKSLR